MVKRRRRSDERGQAITEYILMMSIIAGMAIAVSKALAGLGIADRLMKPIKQDFAAAYRYGHVKAKGYDDGGPEMLPRGPAPANFRLFINPKYK